MNEDLVELMQRIGDEKNPPTNEELDAANTQLKELLREAANSKTPDLESARALREAIDTIDTELKARAEAEVKAQEEAKALLEGLDDEPEEDEEEAPAEEVEVEEVEVKQPVAANLGNAIKKTSSRIQRNAEIESRPDVKVRAMGVAQGYTIGQDATIQDVARLFADEARGVQEGRHPLFRLSFDYPSDRILDRESKASTRVIDSVLNSQSTSYQAVAASGGICGPLDVDFTHPVCGDRSRTIRDALPRFNANRGGIRFQPAVSLADAVDGVTVWTAAVDASPGDNEKAVLVLDCEEELEATVDAIVASVQIGNFQAKFNPEFYRSRLEALMIAHDRIAEQTLWAQLVAASTAVTYGSGDGTISSVLTAVDKAIAGLRSRLRLNPGTAMRVIAPAWVQQALRADIAKQRLGGSLDGLQAADSIINNFFAVRGATPAWSNDLGVFGAQNAGALLDFPSSQADFLVYPEGTFMFLDGGTLDLGTEITDSTLNKTNDRQAFMETFEKGVKRGCESLRVRVPIAEACQCPEELVVDLGSPA